MFQNYNHEKQLLTVMVDNNLQAKDSGYLTSTTITPATKYGW